MQRAIDMLREVKESIMNAYEIKSGLSRHKISQLMDAETWMNAKEAVKLGFADEILFSGTQDKAPDDDGTGMLFSRKAVTDSLLSKLIPKRTEKPKNTVKASDLEKRPVASLTLIYGGIYHDQDYGTYWKSAAKAWGGGEKLP